MIVTDARGATIDAATARRTEPTRTTASRTLGETGEYDPRVLDPEDSASRRAAAGVALDLGPVTTLTTARPDDATTVTIEMMDFGSSHDFVSLFSYSL